MNVKHAANQFECGDPVSCPKGLKGIVRGWDSSNTHVLVELENGEKNYFPVGTHNKSNGMFVVPAHGLDYLNRTKPETETVS